MPAKIISHNKNIMYTNWLNLYQDHSSYNVCQPYANNIQLNSWFVSDLNISGATLICKGVDLDTNQVFRISTTGIY